MMTISSTEHSRKTAIRESARFAGNWVPGADEDSRSLRRRLMAALRLAHRVLGCRHDRLGLGALGAGGLSGIVSAPLGFFSGFGGARGLYAGVALAALTVQFATPAMASTPLGSGTTANASGGQIAVSGGTGCTVQAAVIGAALTGGIAIGCESVANGTSTTAIGVSARATGAYNLALGADARATGVSGATAIGLSSRAFSQDAVAMGTRANALSQNAIAIGTDALIDGVGAVGIGSGNQVTGDYSVVTGDANTVMGIDSHVLGNSNMVIGNSNGVIGNTDNLTADNSFIVGNGSTLNSSNALVLGNNVTVGAGFDGAVVLGTDSTAEAAAGVPGYDPATGLASTDTGATWLSTRSAVSVGNAATGVTRQITGVAAGSADTDAVNLAQLKAAQTAATTQYFSVNDGGTAQGNYNNDGATGINALAAGPNAKAVGLSSVALGNGATAQSNNSVAIGSATTVSGASVSIGQGSSSSNNGAVALGFQDTASGVGAFAAGASSTATGQGAVSFGNSSTALGAAAIAMGDTSLANSGGAIAMGASATAGAGNSIALGSGSTANHADAVALGSGSVTAAAVGTGGATVDGVAYTFAGTTPASTVSVGAAGAERTVTNVAAGRISAGSTDAINGSQLYTTNQAVTALGTNLDTLGNSTAVSLGGTSAYNPLTHTVTAGLDVSGTSYTNVQDALTAVNASATAGWDISAQGANATNVGANSTTGTSVDLSNNDGNIVVAKTTASNDVTFDLASDVVVANSLTVGNSLLDTTGLAIDDGTNATSVTSTGLSIAGGPSVTTTGIDAGSMVIANVAPGVAGTDAVNVDQLNLVGTGLDNLGQSVATSLGGTSNYNPLTDTVTAGLDVSGTSYTSVQDALTAVNASATAGWNVQSNGDVATNVAPGGTVQFLDGQNIAITRSGADITIATTPDLSADSLSLSSGQVFDAAGLNMNGTSITNVAAGVAATDAVNVGQLTAVGAGLDNLGQSVATSLGGTSSYDPLTDTVTAGLDVSGTSYTNVQDALTAVNASATAGWDISAQGANATNVGANSTTGTSVDLSNNDGNIVVAKTTASNDVTFDLASDVVIGNSLTVGNSLLDTTGLTIDDGTNATSVTSTGLSITGGPSVTTTGIDAGSMVIANVAPGAVNATSTDAVNGSQLFAATQAIGNTDQLAVKYDWNDANSDGIVDPGEVNYGKVTLAGDGSGNGTVVANLADGTVSSTSTEAVNGSQLYGVSQSVASHLGGASTVNADGTVTGPTYVVQGGNYNTVYDAFSALDGNLTTINNGGGIKYFHANSTLADSQATGADSVAVGPASVASGTNAVAMGNGANAGGANDVALGSGSVANGATATTGMTVAGANYTFAGTTPPVGTVSVGAAGSERTITNVAAGQVSDSSTDAVNGSQLYAAVQAIETVDNKVDEAGTSIAGIIGGNATYDPSTGTVSGASFDVQGTTYTTVTEAFSAVSGGLTSIQNGSSGVVQRTGNANETALTETGGTGTDPGAAQKLTNLAAGAVSSISADAINGTQLYGVSQSVATNLGGGSVVNTDGTVSAPTYNIAGNSYTNVGDALGALDSQSANAVQYDTDSSGNKLNSVTLKGGDPNAPVLLSNVATGVADTDAVNVKQLKDGVVSANAYTDTKVTWAIDQANTYSDQVGATTLNKANAYTDYKFGQLNQELGEVRGEARQAAAIGLAAASLRYDDRPGKASVAIGGGVWRGEGALAFGAGYTSEEGRVRANVSGTVAGGHVGVGAGLSFTLN